MESTFHYSHAQIEKILFHETVSVTSIMMGKYVAIIGNKTSVLFPFAINPWFVNGDWLVQFTCQHRISMIRDLLSFIVIKYTFLCLVLRDLFVVSCYADT